jgi:hypothetical protein
MDLPGKEETHTQDRLFEAGPAPVSDYHIKSSRSNAKRKKETSTLRCALLLLVLTRNLNSTRSGALQSEDLAGPVQGKKRPEGNLDLCEEQRLAKASTQHQGHRPPGGGMDPCDYIAGHYPELRIQAQGQGP